MNYLHILQIKSTWLEEFGVDRIELDDCLASQELIWIITGVSILAFAIVTFIISFLVYKLSHHPKFNGAPYSRMSNDSQIISSANVQSVSAYKNTSSPFEEVENF